MIVPGLSDNRYTFQNFAVGRSNRSAWTVARMVMNSDVQISNPLLIYGGIGCGKTHLLRAIAHEGWRHGLLIWCTDIDNLRREYIDSIRTRNVSQICTVLSILDLLIVDDVHLIKGMKFTQEALGYAIRDLVNQGVRVVMASTESPRYLSQMIRTYSGSDQSRTVRICSPDWRIRMSILHNKVAQRDINVPRQVMALIVRQSGNDIRRLEGLLNQVCALSRLRECPVTLNMARTAIGDIRNQSECGDEL